MIIIINSKIVIIPVNNQNRIPINWSLLSWFDNVVNGGQLAIT